MTERDPLLVTAKELIDAAELRAERAEWDAKTAKDTLEQERSLFREFMADMLKTDKPPELERTAERIMDFIFDRVNGADWYRNDDGPDPDTVKEQCIAWLTLRLEEIAKK